MTAKGKKVIIGLSLVTLIILIMGIFNFLKKEQNEKVVTNSIGEFSFVKIDGTKNYKGKIKSNFFDTVEVIFPINEDSISEYQIEYFKKIENNWSSISKQLSAKKSDTDFRDYRVVTLLIPDKGSEFYDMDAEIVLEKGKSIFSLILTDLNLDEIIECQ